MVKKQDVLPCFIWRSSSSFSPFPTTTSLLIEGVHPVDVEASSKKRNRRYVFMVLLVICPQFGMRLRQVLTEVRGKIGADGSTTGCVIVLNTLCGASAGERGYWKPRRRPYHGGKRDMNHHVLKSRRQALASSLCIFQPSICQVTLGSRFKNIPCRSSVPDSRSRPSSCTLKYIAFLRAKSCSGSGRYTQHDSPRAEACIYCLGQQPPTPR